MEKITVIYTGGTIGMVPSAQGLVATGGFEGRLRSALAAASGNDLDATFRFVEYPEPIDSAQAGLDLAVRVYQDICRRLDDCERFLVLMGSDTLSYIAPALGYLLHREHVCVAVCGSMLPLGAQHSDALDNIVQAIDLLRGELIPGVHVVFGGQVIPAARCTKLYTHVVEAMVNTQSPHLAPQARSTLDACSPGEVNEFHGFDIRTVRVMPSLHENAVPSLLMGNPDAIIIQCYGSGTAPGESSKFAQALMAANAAAVPLFSVSQALYSYVNFSAYASSRWLLDLGVISCGDMNIEATYTKLWYLLNHGFRDNALREAMHQNLCGEISKAP